MAGGNFDINTPKVRPGQYINFQAEQKSDISMSTRGICLIPLIGYDWGADGDVIKVTADAPNAEIVRLGRSVYDSKNRHMKLVQLALHKAATVYLYIISGGNQASVVQDNLTITAKYGGTRGNDITVSSVANIDGGFDIKVYLEGELVESYERATNIADLTDSDYVIFSGEGALVAFAGANLEGGSSKESTNEQVTNFLDKIEKVKCNTVCFPCSDTALQVAALSKVKYLREKVGKTVQMVMPNYAADYIGVINVTNSFVYDGIELTVEEATAWVAGATAGADKYMDLTLSKVDGATALVGEKINEVAIESIKNGEFFFSVDDEENVVVEYDINSLVNVSSKQDEGYKNNRVIRTFDSFADDIRKAIPNATYDNDEEGWNAMEGLGKALLKAYAGEPKERHAIKNVDLDNDFKVDRSRSKLDNTYFDVAIEPVMTSTKQYYTITTH